MKAIETHNLSKHYHDVRAVDGVTIALDENRIHGLLGRNGAGKTTLMRLLTGQVFATSGEMRVLGASPVENASVLSRTCFIQENQKYPDVFRPVDVVTVAKDIHPGWDDELAGTLAEELRLPMRRQIRKVSRGQVSAVGIVVGLASRAPLTFFDEPYLGLDAVARQLFYDRLLADFAERPRTVVLSTHHIDEAANLLEHAVVIDEGRILLDADSDDLRAMAVRLTGQTRRVEDFLNGREVIGREQLGGLASITVLTGETDGSTAEAARDAGLDVVPVSLQSLVVHLTTSRHSSSAAAGNR